MTPWVQRLLIANALMFLATAFYPPLYPLLWFVPAEALFRPWTIVTYLFLHAGIWHLLFNMLGLYFFGPRLESFLGSARFIRLYLVSGAGGALLSLLTPGIALVGASGAVFGILLAFARYWPRERIYIYALIPIEARVLVIVLAIGSLWLGIGGGPGGGIAHLAHLGGFAGAWLYLRFTERPVLPARRGVGPASGREIRAVLEQIREMPREKLHSLNRDEVERILAKVDQQGVSSLSDEEQEFLRRMTGD